MDMFEALKDLYNSLQFVGRTICKISEAAAFG